jgi:hypothetical protein
VLSRTSNAKDGPLKELHFAQGVAKKEKLKDFVIPLHIDDLPHGDTTIEITRINTVPFTPSWGAGLAKLLEKLEEDKVPKDPKFNRTAVNEWWRTQFSAEQGLRPLDESKPYGIKAGVIGTETGIKCFKHWVEWVQRPVFNASALLGRPPFPGFETVFRSRWNTKPVLTLIRNGRRD